MSKYLNIRLKLYIIINHDYRAYNIIGYVTITAMDSKGIKLEIKKALEFHNRYQLSKVCSYSFGLKQVLNKKYLKMDKKTLTAKFPHSKVSMNFG